MKTTKNTFDVIISGGGLSGSLMALSLAKLRKNDGSALSIAIIEAMNEEVADSSVPPLFDNRVLALSHGSSQYLQSLGVWSEMAQHACAIKHIDISDKSHYGKARLHAQEHGVNALGYVIEMALIGKTLQKALTQFDNVSWFFGNTINDISWQGEEKNQSQSSNDEQEQSHEQDKRKNKSKNKDKNKEWISVTLSSSLMLHTSLLLGCDGAHSPCRQLAKIDIKKSDYEQVALIANVATAKPHHNKAFERFTEQGPIAMLPLTSLKGENRCSLVWTMNKLASEEVKSLSDTQFKKALENTFGSWLGEITQVGNKDVYPLVLVQAEQQTYHRMALIGNASHTIHPIAGQGFNLGLRDVKDLTALITQELSCNKNIGNFSLLTNYSNTRMKDQNEVIALTDSLVTLFSNNLPPLVAGRNIGLKVLNYLTPLKNRLVNKTMGYHL